MPAPHADASQPAEPTGNALLATLFRVGLGVVVLFGAMAIAVALYFTKPEPPAHDEEAARVTVPVITARRVDAPIVWNAYGTARAKSASDVSAEIAGVVAERPAGIDPGRSVREGDLLVRIEAEEYRDIVAQSKARIRALEADLDALDTEAESLDETLALANESVEITEREIERYRAAQSEAGINQIEIERLNRDLTSFKRQREEIKRQVDLIPSRRLRLQAQKQQEHAALRLSELNVERTEIRAPIGGVLQTVEVDAGERVGPGMTVARIVDLSTIEVPVRAPISASAHLREGDEAVLISGTSDTTTWVGTIDRLAPEADQRTRTMTVYIVVEQDPGHAVRMLRPGQYVSARLRSRFREPRLVLPRSTVDADRVIVLNDQHRAEMRDVDVLYHLEASYPEIHPSETQWSVVSGALEPGETVVLNQAHFITPDMLLAPAPVVNSAGTASNGREPEGASGDPS